jgi:starvation-inducible DNA-binding protein
MLKHVKLSDPDGLKSDVVCRCSQRLACRYVRALFEDQEFPLARLGAHFRDYHLMLDHQADQIFVTTDDIAEGVRSVA